MTLSEIIKRRMGKKKLNVRQLSNMTGIAPTTLYSFFRRNSDTISISSFLAIAEALDTSVDDLMNERAIENARESVQPNDSLTSEEREILELYNAVDDKTQKTLKRLLKYHIEINKMYEELTKKNDNKKP